MSNSINFYVLEPFEIFTENGTYAAPSGELKGKSDTNISLNGISKKKSLRIYAPDTSLFKLTQCKTDTITEVVYPLNILNPVINTNIVYNYNYLNQLWKAYNMSDSPLDINRTLTLKANSAPQADSQIYFVVTKQNKIKMISLNKYDSDTSGLYEFDCSNELTIAPSDLPCFICMNWGVQMATGPDATDTTLYSELLNNPHYYDTISDLNNINGINESGVNKSFIQLFILYKIVKVPCLKEGTRISTIAGDVAIENLNIGDLIMDGNNEEVEVKNVIASQKFNDNQLYVLRKNKLGKNYPNQDLFISSNHFVKHNSKIYSPMMNQFFKKCPRQDVKYYNIETNDYINDWIKANNVEVETFNNMNELNVEEGFKRYKKALKNNNRQNKKLQNKKTPE